MNKIFGMFSLYWNRKKGIKLYNEKKYEESLEFFNKAINVKSTPELLNYKGYLFEKLGRFNKSLKTYDESLRLEPNNKRVIISKARVSELVGKYEDALSCYFDLLKLGCNDLFVYSEIGSLFKKLGNFSKAIKYYDKGLKLDPNNVEILNNESIVLHLLKEYEKALNLLNMAIELDSNDSDILCNKGHVLSELGRKKEALEFYKKTLELNTKDPKVYSYIGITYADLNNREEALKYFKKAVFYINNELEKNHDCCDLLINKSISLFYLGMQNEAFDVINKVLKRDPNNLNAMSYKAYYLKEKKEYQNSLLYYNKLLELSNDERFIKQRKEVLSLLENNEKD